MRFSGSLEWQTLFYEGSLAQATPQFVPRSTNRGIAQENQSEILCDCFTDEKYYLTE